MPQTSQSPIDDGVAAFLIATLGEEAAGSMIRHFGGTSRRVPTSARLKQDHDFIQVLGREMAEKLCFAAGGEKIYIPRRLTSYRERCTLVAQLSAEGQSDQVIARQLEISDRAVAKIRRSLREGTVQ